MDKTIYTLKLGGNDVTLKFTIGTLRKLRDLMDGQDPLASLQGLGELSAIDMAEKITKAAILQYDKSADVSALSDHFDELKPSDAAGIISAFARAYSPDAPPEGGQDTQQ